MFNLIKTIKNAGQNRHFLFMKTDDTMRYERIRWASPIDGMLRPFRAVSG
jgi:hypothetical protein